MYPYFIILTPNDYEIINTASIIVLSLSLIGVLVMWTIQMLQAERIAVLKKTIQIKDIRIAELDQSLTLRYENIKELRKTVRLFSFLKEMAEIQVNHALGIIKRLRHENAELKTIKKYFMNLSNRESLQTQSPQAQELEEKIWNHGIEQEQKIGDRT
jgi:hypothetical protein